MLLVDVRDRPRRAAVVAATGDERAPLGHADEEREPAPRLEAAVGEGREVLGHSLDHSPRAWRRTPHEVAEPRARRRRVAVGAVGDEAAERVEVAALRVERQASASGSGSASETTRAPRPRPGP